MLVSFYFSVNMNSFLNLLLYRHRRFKGETYFRNRFPLMLIISSIFSIFIADNLSGFFILLIVFLSIDLLLAFGAWLFYKTDL